MKDHDLATRREIEIALLNKGQESRRYKLGETWELNYDEIREALDELTPIHTKNSMEYATQPEQRWIPCSERLPACEQEVLICTKKKVVGKNAYIDSIITPALYEDGTMLEIDSKWRWEDIDYDKWDEENDCGIIPEGWWENRHFNPDDVYNNVVDREVVAWMPLPECYQEGVDNE